MLTKNWSYGENVKKSEWVRGGQGGCERRIEVIVKIKKVRRWIRGGVRMSVWM